MDSKMTVAQIVEKVLAAHKPELVKQHSVIMLCYDGEQQYTKGGDIFGMRSVHVTQAGFLEAVSWCEELHTTLREKMPEVLGVKRIVCAESEASELRDLMWSYAINEHGHVSDAAVTDEAIGLHVRVVLLQRLITEMCAKSDARFKAARATKGN